MSPVTRKSSTNVPVNIQVLSSRDEERYRAIFDAQTRGDWKEADSLIAKVKDRGLLGHVLADRYARRKPTAAELSSWLAAYADLPEAPALFKKLRHLPAARHAKLARPAFADLWSGSDSYEISYGFNKAESGLKKSDAARRLETKINHALRRGDPGSAEDILFAELNRRALSSEELGEHEGRIAAGYYYAGNVAYARKLATDSMPTQDPLGLWISGLSAWKQGDVHAAAMAFDRLAARPGLAAADRAAASFWAYRAFKQEGQTQKARVLLEDAARQTRTFYGLLAASLIGHDAEWSWQLPALDTSKITVLAKNPAGWRALALIQIDQRYMAESELRHLNPQGQRNLQEAMLALADTVHMPALAVQLGGLGTGDKAKRYDAALYPVPPWLPQEGFQVDRALIYALIRHELHFDPGAVSGSGACGLMQVMPATANLVANDTVADHDCSGRMLEPAFNIGLGQKYIRHLADQPAIGDNLLFLLAAYNGGPSKLARWMDDKTGRDPLLFLESLPLRETRDYVQQVLMHYWGYRSRLGEPETSLAQLARGQWPRYALHEVLPVKDLKEASAGGFKVASEER